MNLFLHIGLRIESFPTLASFVYEIFLNDVLTLFVASLLVAVKETMIISTKPVQIINVHWSTHGCLDTQRKQEEEGINHEGILDLKESNADLVDQEIES